MQIISDVHLELRKHPPSEIKVSGDVLALCGDIGGPKQNSYHDMIRWASSNYMWVFVVAGNHEFYCSSLSVDEIKDRIRAAIARFPNVTFLDSYGITVRMRDKRIRVFGSTLWTDTTGCGPEIKARMNDYQRVKKKVYNARGYIRVPVTPLDTTSMHLDAVRELKAEIEACAIAGTELVVLTHHLPSFSLIDKNSHPRDSIVSSAYASDLDHLIGWPIILWAHGHQHRHHDMQVGDVRVVCNPMGYPGQDTTGYRDDFAVDVGKK